MNFVQRFVILPLITVLAALSLILITPATAANTAQAATTCLFSGRSGNPRIYNAGGVQGTIHIKRRDGSQISIGVGASAYVCPYRIWLDHRNIAVIRCSNNVTYVAESTWYNAFRYLSDDSKGEFWDCGFFGGSGSAKISTQRE